jgi:hypothetical protein
MASKYKQLIMLSNMKKLAVDMCKDFSMLEYNNLTLAGNGNAIRYKFQTHGIRVVTITNNDVTIVTKVGVYEDQNKEPKLYYHTIKNHTPMLDYDKLKGICYASVKKFLATLPDVEKQIKEIKMIKKLNDVEKDFVED